jgi:hypothetical protein
VSGPGRLPLLALGALAAACGGSAGRLDRVPEGPWGGEHVSLVVRATGAEVDLDCAHGEITVPLRLGPDGRFSLPGYYVRDVGPTFDPENREPATYFGSSDGRRLTLSFALENGDSDGPFTAFPGGPLLVQQCR